MKQAGIMNFLDKELEHLLGNGEIRDDAIFHGPNRGDVAWRAAQHLFGFEANCLYGLLAAGPAFLADRHH